MGHRELEVVCPRALADAIARAPFDQAVVWTGRAYAAKPGSLRSNALALVARPGVPMPLRDLLRRAAGIGGDRGYDPDLVRNAVRLHQSARPAAYILVRRTPCGEYVAVSDVPYPAAGKDRIRAGQLVIDAAGRWALDLACGREARAC